MKAYKKIAATVLSLVMAGSAFAFAGCGSGDDSGDTDEVKVVRIWVHKSAIMITTTPTIMIVGK